MATLTLDLDPCIVSAPPSPYTVSDLLTAYEQECLPDKAPSTQYQQLQRFKQVRQEMGTVLLTDLTPAFLRQWRDTLTNRGYAPGTVTRYMDALAAPLTFAVRELEWLPSNPMRKVRKPPATPSRTRFLSPEERTALLTACKRSRNPHLHTVVVMALATGCRKNELLQLRWRDVDLTRGVIRLARTKNKERRAVPLIGPALEVLRTCRQDAPPDAWVFARWDGLKPVTIDEVFQYVCRWAGLENFHFHDLRHTCASYMAMSGATLREIAEVLGHKSIQVTLKYAHMTTGHTAGVLDRMHQQFLGEGGSHGTAL